MGIVVFLKKDNRHPMAPTTAPALLVFLTYLDVGNAGVAGAFTCRRPRRSRMGSIKSVLFSMARDLRRGDDGKKTLSFQLSRKLLLPRSRLAISMKHDGHADESRHYDCDVGDAGELFEHH